MFILTFFGDIFKLLSTGRKNITYLIYALEKDAYNKHLLYLQLKFFLVYKNLHHTNHLNSERLIKNFVRVFIFYFFFSNGATKKQKEKKKKRDYFGKEKVI